MGYQTDKYAPIIHFGKVGGNFKHSLNLLSNAGTWVLRDVNIDLLAGQALGVIARKEAGKCTLVRLLADLIEPDDGTISRQDIDVLLLSLGLGFLPHLSGQKTLFSVIFCSACAAKK